MMTETSEPCNGAPRTLPVTRKRDLGLWQIAADLMVRYGPAAEQEAIRLANLMLERGDREKQVEWLRVWTVIVLLSSGAMKEAAE